MNILIADDDLASRISLRKLLEASGDDVVTAENGLETLNRLHHDTNLALMILDWMMPELDGFEVLEHLRQEMPDRLRYIILLTARDSKEDLVKGLEAGADDYLVKPFDPSELRARINVGKRVLRLQRLLKQKVNELEAALDEVHTLRGIVPICSSCKKMRDDQGYWTQVEDYIRQHTKVQFSHGLCPSCMGRLYPDMDDQSVSGHP